MTEALISEVLRLVQWDHWNKDYKIGTLLTWNRGMIYPYWKSALSITTHHFYLVYRHFYIQLKMTELIDCSSVMITLNYFSSLRAYFCCSTEPFGLSKNSQHKSHVHLEEMVTKLFILNCWVVSTGMCIQAVTFKVNIHADPHCLW